MPERDDSLPLLTGPGLSIGMPVYNGGATMRTAIDSLLAQDFGDFELIIADNASTDETPDIARRYAAADSRIRYIRHAENCGAFANYAYVLDVARADFFMWAAADDIWSRDFARLNVGFLRGHPSYVSSISPVRFEGQAGDPGFMGDGVLMAATLGDRVCRFLSLWHGNSVFYSVFRRRILADSLSPVGHYLGFDWTVMLRATRSGPSMRLTSGEIVRGARGISSSGTIFRASRSRTLHWALPFVDMSWQALLTVRGETWRARAIVALALARLNFAAARAQLGYERRAGRQ